MGLYRSSLITFAINSRADGQVVSDLLEVAINGTFPYTNVQLRQIAQVDFNSASRNGKLEQWTELLLEADRIELYEWAVNRALWTCRLVPPRYALHSGQAGRYKT